MKTYDCQRAPNLQKIADLEAEIAKLKESLELQIHVTGSASACIDERNKLITELADALDFTASLYSELVQRAREATR